MRIYSNTPLSWPHILHTFQAAHVFPGRWYNYYFYRIKKIHPLIIHTYSPLEFLEVNNRYYCYDKYYRNMFLENFGNKPSLLGKDNWVYIPCIADVNDIIVIQNDNNNLAPTEKHPSWFMNKSLTLQ